jgi:hypothetical protein
LDLIIHMDLAALRRWWPLAAVLGLLGLTALAATRSKAQLDRIPPRTEEVITQVRKPTGSQATPAGGAGPAGDGAGGLPDWVINAALVALAVLVVVALALVIWALVRDQLRRTNRRGKRRQPARNTPRTADDLVAALDAGLLDLSDTDLDPRRAVIACWLRLEQAAADAGTPRHPGDTPGDLVGRLLAEQQVDAGVLVDLAAVYRRARYASHTVDEDMRVDARAALQRLRADLAASARAAASAVEAGIR